ncbi:adenosylcobinamide-phosphate synthase CbiB [Halorussus limi]|uniref:Probable cobalamin biosynthesis protein CobD n=1 Tax=Halorussus limi TaxID=2938695 RepID=A0A8U0HPI8_9EURY|nr:adenosylcobinamide-phosphate synthase CbiB [Halorussus limi]UPV72870.1 adenosylcobinamide-phosphate synthase CbiB [Halorussus limi]
MNAAVPVAIALALDAAIAEPPRRLHPVALFGSLVAVFDREWSRPRIAGLAVAAALPLLAAATVALAVEVAVRLHPVAGALAAGIVVFAATSLRMLTETATEVVAATETDLSAARERLRWLAGRDAADLSAAEVRSAAVESAAENLADGAVAALLAFALLAPVSLPAGAAAAVWVKAVNTLDSMLGYPDKAHGTASARLDDAVMWIPARVSAGLLAVAALVPLSGAGARRRLASLSAARRWAAAPPSPNSGWPMATLAAVVDARLEKPGVYVLNPDAALPSVETSRAGVRVVRAAGVLAFLLAALLAGVGYAFAPEVVAWL